MAKVSQPEIKHTCGDCSLGTDIKELWNKALDGHYICVRCPNSQRARLKSESACELFKS